MKLFALSLATFFALNLGFADPAEAMKRTYQPNKKRRQDIEKKSHDDSSIIPFGDLLEDDTFPNDRNSLLNKKDRIERKKEVKTPVFKEKIRRKRK